LALDQRDALPTDANGARLKWEHLEWLSNAVDKKCRRLGVRRAAG
jgi:hypothetical protein